MKKYIYLILLNLFLCYCSSNRTSNFLDLSFSESENKTLIKNFYHIDSLTINGKWEIEKSSEKIIHHIPLKNNNLSLEIFVEKINQLNYYNKKLNNEILLEKYILSKYGNYNFTKLKCEIVKMNKEEEFYCVEYENKLELIGIKKATIFSVFINSTQMNNLEKTNFLIDFFKHVDI